MNERKIDSNYERFAEGKSVNIYYIGKINYLDTGKGGINYKDKELYARPRILIRKTGIGMHATIDDLGNFTGTIFPVFYYPG